MNEDGVQTWRMRVTPLSREEDDRICAAAEKDVRGMKIRAKQAQLELGL
jgi:hypothetical protein